MRRNERVNRNSKQKTTGFATRRPRANELKEREQRFVKIPGGSLKLYIKYQNELWEFTGSRV